LTTKAAKAKAAEAKDEAKDEAKAEKSAAVLQAGAKQKVKKQAATEKQKAAAAPAMEDAAVKSSCTVSFPGARVVLVIAALFFAAATMALPSNSSMPTGVAEVVTPKSIFSLANDQQCGLNDNDDSCAVQEAFATTCSVPTLPHLDT